MTTRRSFVHLALGGLLVGGLVAAGPATPLPAAGQDKQNFVGTITDDNCSTADHSRMRMGATDEACATACFDAHGASYVLFDGKTAYGLSDQKTAATLVAKRVRVVGTLDGKTGKIAVESMRAQP